MMGIVRDTPTWVLRFDFRARVGPLTAVDRTVSWLDPVRLVALRFHELDGLGELRENAEHRIGRKIRLRGLL